MDAVGLRLFKSASAIRAKPVALCWRFSSGRPSFASFLTYRRTSASTIANLPASGLSVQRPASLEAIGDDAENKASGAPTEIADSALGSSLRIVSSPTLVTNLTGGSVKPHRLLITDYASKGREVRARKRRGNRGALPARLPWIEVVTSLPARRQRQLGRSEYGGCAS